MIYGTKPKRTDPLDCVFRGRPIVPFSEAKAPSFGSGAPRPSLRPLGTHSSVSVLEVKNQNHPKSVAEEEVAVGNHRN